jgi:hypothetical protein
MYVFLVVQRLQDTIGLGSCHNRYGINHHLKTINNITLKPRLYATRTLFVEERLPFPVQLVQARVGPRGGRGELVA